MGGPCSGGSVRAENLNLLDDLLKGSNIDIYADADIQPLPPRYEVKVLIIDQFDGLANAVFFH